MSNALLATKLFIPEPRPGVVSRHRLLEELNLGLGRRLTLVSAPAGYGKTTQVAEWLKEAGVPAGWISLDEGDNDPVQFFTYLVAALQKISSSIGERALAAIQVTQLPDYPDLIAYLIDEILSIQERFIIVMDDFHVIRDPELQEALRYLVDHQPPLMHLVIISRTDPQLPLARIRAGGFITEIRKEDLRFNKIETTNFLNLTVGAIISEEEVAALERRTEGWVAGLQLAAVSLSGSTDVSNFIKEFTGSHRYMIDYLVEEVLSKQAPDVQNFLLKTSILQRFNAGLCESVTGRLDSVEILSYIEQANLFLVRMDNRREWFRYHHLFAEFLAQRFRVEAGDDHRDVYLKASVWHESQNDFDAAIRYALAAKDEELAVRLLDEVAFPLVSDSMIKRMLNWVDRLPKHLRYKYPRLCVAHAWALNFADQLDDIDELLDAAESHFSSPEALPEDYPVPILAAFADTVRAYVALRQNRSEDADKIAGQTLQNLPSEPEANVKILRATLTLNLGLAALQLGNIPDAEAYLQAAVSLNRDAKRKMGSFASVRYFMHFRIVQGRLDQAIALGVQGLGWVDEWSTDGGIVRRSFPAEGEIRQELSAAFYEKDELAESELHLRRAFDLYRVQGGIRPKVKCYNQLFLLHLARQELDTALEYMDKIDLLMIDSEFPGFHIFEAQRAHRHLMFWERSGDKKYLAKASLWVDRSGMHPSDSFAFWQEIMYATLARCLIAGGQSERGLPLVNRLCRAAERDKRNGDLIKNQILQALALSGLQREQEAAHAIIKAISLSVPSGYIRAFIDEGDSIHTLLQHPSVNLAHPEYVRTLLDAYGDTQTPEAGQFLSEPLTDRELDVLRLMEAGLSGPQIAENLFISFNTVKTHSKSIYRKLGVNRKYDALKLAQELNLI